MLLLLSIAVFVCFVLTPIAATVNFENDALALINEYREKHESPPLQLNEELNNYSQNLAKQMADQNFVFENHGDGTYGESLYVTKDTKLNDSKIVLQAIEEWYTESDRYNYRDPQYSPSTQHFTQMIWMESKELGIGIERSQDNAFCSFTYYPPGNVRGRFPQNVNYPEKNDALRKEALSIHNSYRDKHHSPPLVISTDLNNYAQQLANRMVRDSSYELNSKDSGKYGEGGAYVESRKYGESVYLTGDSKSSDMEILNRAMSEWYRESDSYDYAKPYYSPSTMHFTQIVWKNTKRLGFGIARSNNKVCCSFIYYPPGNGFDLGFGDRNNQSDRNNKNGFPQNVCYP